MTEPSFPPPQGFEEHLHTNHTHTHTHTQDESIGGNRQGEQWMTRWQDSNGVPTQDAAAITTAAIYKRQPRSYEQCVLPWPWVD
jgi:hypothetical protein